MRSIIFTVMGSGNDFGTQIPLCFVLKGAKRNTSSNGNCIIVAVGVLEAHVGETLTYFNNICMVIKLNMIRVLLLTSLQS